MFRRISSISNTLTSIVLIALIGFVIPQFSDLPNAKSITSHVKMRWEITGSDIVMQFEKSR